uniref:non-canonical purine NTP pyrophosphatase n=1 Tax=Lactobacillus crispatus TaxID=47770 RepID=UPI0025460EBE
MVKEILFATGNQGKAKELKEAFKQAGVDIEIKTNADLDNPPHPIESGHTFEANAKIKAHELAEFSKLPTIADDSGLMVDALNGAVSYTHLRAHETSSNLVC